MSPAKLSFDILSLTIIVKNPSSFCLFLRQEEDLFIMAYGLPLNAEGDDKCLSLLNAVEEDVARKLRACKAPLSKRKSLEGTYQILHKILVEHPVFILGRI